MKKTICIVLTLLCVLLTLPMTAAAADSAKLTGPSAVRAGDTITLTFSLSGSNIYGVTGELVYDTNQVTLSSVDQKIASPWKLDVNDNNIVAYDDDMSSPIKTSNKAVFTVTFKVKSNVATGVQIKISIKNVTTTDGDNDTELGTVSYTKSVAAPLSTNAQLKSLTVSNATISPSFSANTTSYTASVPFDVSKLDVTATAADSKATVKVNSPNLTPNGTTKVTVTVTAENGSKKTYTITVTRAQDPNYQPSSNNKLSGITVNGYVLSPVFSADNTQYVVWLPYETDKITVSGTAADSKASVRVEGGSNLVAGQDNTVKVICTAENGEEKEYIVIAKRAAAHGSASTQPSETDPSTTTTTMSEDTTTTTATEMSAPAGGVSKKTALLLAGGAGVVAVILGFILGFLIGKKRR